MKIQFLRISALLFGAGVLFTGCLDDDSIKSGGSSSESSETVIPGNSEIDARIFEALDFERPGLAAVQTYYSAGEYYLAAQALLEYYRSRTDVPNGNVNLIAPTITADEQAQADWALAKNDYRFYVEGYMDGDKPYSYLASNKIDWTARSADAGEHYGVHRLAWMLSQGKAYRLSLDEAYVDGWMTVFSDWMENYPRPEGIADYEADPSSQGVDPEVAERLYAWRPAEVAARLEDQCDLLYYFMQSTSVTPQFFSAFMSNVAEQAAHVYGNYSEESAEQTSEAHAMFRAGTIFPELKNAAAWVETGSGSMNDGIDTKIFEVLNLEYGGLSRVKNAYEIGDYYKGMEELLTYYRSRQHGLNPNVNIATDAATANQLLWAEQAFRENGYRFYVNNYYDAAAGENIPYSYMTSDGGIDWTLWPTREQEQRYQLHRHQWMVMQGKAYNTTKNEAFVENWKEVYADWMRQNPKPDVDLDYTVYPENQAPEYRNAGWSWRPLDVAARLIDRCAVLEYFQDSPSITAEWLAEVLVHIDEEANHIMNNYSTTSNHLITQAQAVTFAGMLFPELKNSATWKQSGGDVLAREVTAQYFPDGWLMDGDLSYHIAGIEDFRLSMLIAQLNGEAGRFPASFVEAMRKMTEVVMNMVYPDYSVPNMADTRRSSYTRNVLTRNLTNYSNLFPDNQEMLWMATGGLSGTMPETRVKTFPDGGYYVMRTGWTMADMMMVLQNTPDGPAEQWHRQYDNNTFELWIKGRNFFPDSGCYSYGGSTSSNASRAKYAASTAHNTLTLNGKNVASDGRLVKTDAVSGSSFSYDYLVLENPSYANLTHRRVVFLVDDKFWVILDEAIGSAEGTVNLNFNITEGTESQVVLDNAQGGFHTAFADGNNLLVRTATTASTRAFASREGFVSYAINTTAARQAYSLNCQKSADETLYYVTVLLPTADASTADVAVSLSEVASRTVRVQVDGTTYKLSYSL
ncbi:MAG: heparinase II/III family protein [Alistipes sp.]|nr:heparinase II/III family protein [Alistipes sp.]